MSITLLKKIAVKLEKKQSSIFTYPVKKQADYIGHFGAPKDEIERSYFQYCCQMKLYGTFLYALLNIASLPLAIVLLCKYKGRTVKPDRVAECVFFQNGLPANVVPNSLRQRYSDIVSVTGQDNCLMKSDVAFLKEIFKRYPFSWMLWLKTILKVSQYSAAIMKYSPDAMISCDEFSFTSSIVTKYCRTKDIKRINVMHGEKLYYMRDSFVCYDEYYVWNQYYADLLMELGAEKTQFRIELPDSMIIHMEDGAQKMYDYTYYLAAENEIVLKRIAKCLNKLKGKGFRVAVRPHPRYSDMDKIKEIFNDMDIENVKDVSIEGSLCRTKGAISLYSTVLNQAMVTGIDVVIDDVTNPENYSKLKELHYVMLSAEHALLSALVEDK